MIRLIAIGRRSFSSSVTASSNNVTRYATSNGDVVWGTEKRGSTVVPVANPLYPSEYPESLSPVTVTSTLAPLPVDPPPAIIAVGLNYRKHADEVGLPVPRNPILFYKNPSSVCGPEDEILIPKVASRNPNETDSEVELAVFIGKRCKDVSVENALEYVLGYTVANDVGCRRWQALIYCIHYMWWAMVSKSFDTFTPLGPSLLPATELINPQKLKLSAEVNEEILQSSSTEDMIFSVAELISYISQDTTLLPGTIILTGTPEGVGYIRQPPKFLLPGDRVTCNIENIGKISNTVRDA
eukprot:GSMAST32.ASY1.ANO1.13.1 assembled CDS